jgi:hypothetical protein
MTFTCPGCEHQASRVVGRYSCQCRLCRGIGVYYCKTPTCDIEAVIVRGGHISATKRKKPEKKKTMKIVGCKHRSRKVKEDA